MFLYFLLFVLCCLVNLRTSVISSPSSSSVGIALYLILFRKLSDLSDTDCKRLLKVAFNLVPKDNLFHDSGAFSGVF